MNRRESLAVISVGSLICLAGCTSDDPEPATSKDTAPVTLRLATYDEESATGGILIDHFAQTVHDLDPTITIEPMFQAAPDEVAAIKLIQAGDAELGLVATRAWDLVGVDSMRAINTPFLIDSTELLDQVVAGDQAATMMEGLSAAGMTGLAMLPESLRHPFGTEAAPLGVGDYDGATIRSPHSTTSWDVLGALGAAPMFEDDGYTIAESQYDQAPGPEGTGNVTLFAKADVIVISDAARPTVSDSQLDALTEAAETTRDWAIGTFPDDAVAAAGFCDNGGKIVAASAADLAGLGDAVAPVIADLKKDATTAGIITAIEELKSGITVPAPVTACPAPPAASQASAAQRHLPLGGDPAGPRRGRSHQSSSARRCPEHQHGDPRGRQLRRRLQSRPRARTRATPENSTPPTSSTARPSPSTGVSRRPTAPRQMCRS